MKKFLILLLIPAMILTLTACEPKQDDQSRENTAEAPEAKLSSSSDQESTSADVDQAVDKDNFEISEQLKSSDLYARMTGSVKNEEEIFSTGPHGEKATHAASLALTEEEINQIRQANYTVALCMHYGGNDWSTSQIKGITDACEILGMQVVATTDANFSAEQQVADIETVMALNPDVIISIPTDATATADAYKRAADAGIKIVFMDNCPIGLKAGEDYISVVSADNYGNGIIAADLIGEALQGEGEIATVFYDVDFFVTNQRLEAFKKTMAEKYPKIKIVTEQGFTDASACDVQGDAILTQYPDVDAIFCHWDVPCEGVLSSIRAAGAKTLLSTIDLGNNIALEIAKGNVLGLGAQRPYDQGVAEVLCAAYSLLGKDTPDYVAVSALRVDQDNILEAYKDVYYVDAPDWLVEAYSEKTGN